MSNLSSLSIIEPPAITKVIVDYYDDHHRDLLEQSAAGEIFKDSAFPMTMEIPTAEILTYYLFYKKRPGSEGYGSYDEIRPKYQNAIVELDGVVQFANGSLIATKKSAVNRGTTERLGEAIGLSVVSNLHGLSDADWSRIPESNQKETMDFEYGASDGKTLLVAETKDSIGENPKLKSPSVSQHKTDIESKKKASHSPAVGNSLLYGTIAVVGDQIDKLARCWLLDPPLEIEVSPQRFRLLSRLTAIAELITFISPTSMLATAVQNRLAALKALTDISELDGIPLLRGDRKEFSTYTFDQFGSHHPFLGFKSTVSDGPAGGQVFQLDEKSILFIGLREDLLDLAIDQSFQSIREFKFPSGTVHKKVQCFVPNGRFKSEFSLGSRAFDVTNKGAYTGFELEGALHYTSGGMVFGILPLGEGG